MSRWRKLGRIYEPQALHPKLATHAANPLALPLGGDLFRVYFSGRDDKNRSSVGYVEMDIRQREVVYVHDRPVFEHGPPDSFFSHGVSIGNCYRTRTGLYMLFMGWHSPEDAHWRGEIGRLIVAGDAGLALDPARPLLAISDQDSVSLSYPWVIGDGQDFRMWYGSTLAWDAGNGEMLHVINQATSADGNTWQRHGLALPFTVGVAQAFSRPTVLGNAANRFEMWFSYRGAPGRTYRIGYARSHDGNAWTSHIDEVGIDVSDTGWDSEMICYPCVFEHAGAGYMLYNGNGYGRTGFGLAICEA